MYNMMDSNNIWLSVIYFFFVVIFGTWFILNLILAVFMDSFKRVDEEMDAEKKQKKAEEEREKIEKRQREEEEADLQHSDEKPAVNPNIQSTLGRLFGVTA